MHAASILLSHDSKCYCKQPPVFGTFCFCTFGTINSNGIRKHSLDNGSGGIINNKSYTFTSHSLQPMVLTVILCSNMDNLDKINLVYAPMCYLTVMETDFQV